MTMFSINDNVFRTGAEPRRPSTGAVLVAEPLLSQDFFTHGVISLVDYSRTAGTTGVVMNYRSAYTLDEIIEGVERKESRVPVYCGGPVGLDRLLFIHSLGPEIIADARQYADGLYIGGSFDDAIDYVNAGYPLERCIRFFVGYSSWEAGQLEHELLDRTWAVETHPGDGASMLSGRGDSYWHRFVKQLGDEYRPWRLMPRDVHCN